MATLVTFHAHPDDESIACGGVMRKAADEGHRVVLVVATGGELGEVAEGFLDGAETLAQRRFVETHAAAEILGVQRVEFLGYTDSGMMGDASNTAPGSLWTTPVDDAAGKLASILREEEPDVLTIYDDNGGYGHPDHIMVHRVGRRAAELAGTEHVYQATHNRDHMVRMMAEFATLSEEFGIEPPDVADDPNFGKPEAEITATVDVRPYVEHKRRAMRAHASQIGEDHLFLRMPDELFTAMCGTEWFIRDGEGPAVTETELPLR